MGNPTEHYIPTSVLPVVPSVPIAEAIERAVRDYLADQHLEGIGNIERPSLIRQEFIIDAFDNWGLLPLYSRFFPLVCMTRLYENRWEFNIHLGTRHSMNLFAEAMELAYAFRWITNADGRRTAVEIDIYPFNPDPNANQQRYIRDAFQFMFGTQVEVTRLHVNRRELVNVHIYPVEYQIDYQIGDE